MSRQSFKHAISVSLLRFALAFFCTLTLIENSFGSDLTGDTEKMYGHLYLHPKQMAGSVSVPDGWTDLQYADGTVERWPTRELDARDRLDRQTMDAFKMNPSNETFAQLTQIQKYGVVSRSKWMTARDIPDELRGKPENEEKREEYYRRFQGQADAYLSTLPKGEEDRILQSSLNIAISQAGENALSASRTSELFRSITKGNLGKMRQIICGRLYSPDVPDGPDSDEYTNFNEYDFVYTAMNAVLTDLPHRQQLMEQTCPLKDGKGTFKIGDQIARLSAKFAPKDLAENGAASEATKGQIRILSQVKCSKEDFLSELNDVELDFIRTPGPHTNWFRHSEGECRFQGSVKKIANGKFQFQLQAALPGEAKLSPVPFKNFDELKVKLNQLN